MPANYNESTAQAVLDQNYADEFTMPNKDLYPHMWLWDSSFHAIGLRHSNPKRALNEIKILLRSQWPNGMIPHMTFTQRDTKRIHGYKIWKSHVCDDCVVGLKTSAITQPPVIAEAFELVVEKLPKKEQRAAIEKYLPQLIRYHEWLYRERDPNSTGRVVIIHPWESGMDNNPALIENLRQCFPITWWEKQFLKNPFIKAFYHARRKDIRLTSPEERTHSDVNWMLGKLIARYRRKLYKLDDILKDNNSFVVECILFNTALARSNASLSRLAKKTQTTLTSELQESIKKTENSFDDYWNDQDQKFYDRDWHSQTHIRIPTISNLLPLAAKKLPKQQADSIKEVLGSQGYSTKWRTATTPQDTQWFSSVRYWQGPVWVNTNWFLIKGLENNGAKKEATKLKRQTIKLVEQSGMWEYFSPLDGSGRGIHDFSWTAALYLDLKN